MKKRGAGNVEFILSFVLFVGFTIAAIYFFNPIRSVQNLESTQDYVLGAIISNTSVDLDAYSVKITAPDNVRSIAISLPGISFEKKARVVDYYGSEINSKRDGDEVCIDRENGEDFVTIYFSEDITGNSESCGGSSEYKIASSITSEVMSEKRIKELNNSYYSDYASLKSQLDIPGNVDFAFSVEFADGQIISADRELLARREVYSETKIKEILRENGKSEFGYLMVKVW